MQLAPSKHDPGKSMKINFQLNRSGLESVKAGQVTGGLAGNTQYRRTRIGHNTPYNELRLMLLMRY